MGTTRQHPLPNRVDPFGKLFATPQRGQWLGNRGGQFHLTGTSILKGRPWASRQWICCVLSFKNRRRTVWSEGYTELFFADEATALAAGHRPCFECRRADATAFATAWGHATGKAPPRAPEMDAMLHAERLDEAGHKRLHARPFDDLPDGAVVSFNDAAWLVRVDTLLPWSFAGYGEAQARPSRGIAQVITPPSIVSVLQEGYLPVEWRSSSLPLAGRVALHEVEDREGGALPSTENAVQPPSGQPSAVHLPHKGEG